MEIIVTSHPDVRLGLTRPAFYARFGLVFTAGTILLSPLADWVGFRHQVETTSPPVRFMFEKLLKLQATEEDRTTLQTIWASYRAVQSRPRKSGPDIVHMKKTEQWLREEFRDWGRNHFEKFVKAVGFDVFEHCSKEDGLSLHHIMPDVPEDKKLNYRTLSQFLRFDFDQGAQGPCLFLVTDKGIGHFMDANIDLYHFLDLPNLNNLNYEGLMACRQRMRPVADALAPVARQWWEACTAPGGPDPEKLRAQMEADVNGLREMSDPLVRADPDMQWLNSLIPGQNWDMGAWFALCPHALLLECLDANGVILPATATVLESLKDVPGPPPYVPILIIGPGMDRNEKIEEVHDHAEQPDEQPTGLRSLDID